MKKYIIILLLAAPFMGFSQDGNINLWTGISVSKNITKKFSVDLTGQWRLTDNLSRTGAYIGELGLVYKLNKHWDVDVYYRFISRNKYDNGDEAYVFKYYHRFYANLSYDTKIGILKFDYRLRYQNQFKDDNGTLENDKSYLRNKFGVSYPNKSDFTPSLSADVFYRIGNGFDEIRYKAEVDYKINKKNSISLGGFTTQELSGTKVSDFTIVLNYKLKL